MAVSVPMVIGLGRAAAEAKLFSLHLRHIGKFPFAAAGDGTATMQSPTPGALVPPIVAQLPLTVRTVGRHGRRRTDSARGHLRRLDQSGHGRRSLGQRPGCLD